MERSNNPLTLSGGNTSDDQRRSLIQKYKQDLEGKDEVNYTASDDRNSELDRGLTAQKKKKYMIFGGIGVIVLILLIVIIVVASGPKKRDPDTPPTPEDPIIVNPFNIDGGGLDEKSSSYGSRVFKLTRNKVLTKFNSPAYVKETESNKFIEKAELKHSAKHYTTSRVQIYDSDQK